MTAKRVYAMTDRERAAAAKREGEPEWPTRERNGYEKFVERGCIAYLRHLKALNASSPCAPAPAEAAA